MKDTLLEQITFSAVSRFLIYESFKYFTPIILCACGTNILILVGIIQ
jgi:hypothetical protein